MSKVKPTAKDVNRVDAVEVEPSDVETSDAKREVMVKFLSADGEIHHLEEKVARKFMFDDIMYQYAIAEDEPIPMGNIDSFVLTIMIKWAERHVNDQDTDTVSDDDYDENGVRRCDDIDEWDSELFNLEVQLLGLLIKAANYRNMTGLTTVVAKKLASQIKGKNSDELREYLMLE